MKYSGGKSKTGSPPLHIAVLITADEWVSW